MNLKRNNYDKWCQCSIEERQVEEIEANEPSLTDLIEGIDL